jgi:hypothetical protein
MDPTGGSELELRLIFSEHKMKETNSFEIKNTAHPVLVIRYENM